MESSSEVSPLLIISALAVFKNIINEELIRSFHVYQSDNGMEVWMEREFLFQKNASYVEMATQPLLRLSRDQVSSLFQGKLMGVWLCMMIFDIESPSSTTSIPAKLVLSRNPKLETVPNLVRDLQMIIRWSSVEVTEQFGNEVYNVDGNQVERSERLGHVFHQDLNCLPYAMDSATSSPLQNQQNNIPPPPENEKKKRKKKAVSERVARIELDDLVKYFELPISEASKSLNVGLTVLKRRCRELGIPRWPHRKIKSLDILIQDLQEEVERQGRNSEAASVAVQMRKEMIENEKEIIEKKPFLEIKSETKRFRQDVFKRRHRARTLKNKFSSFV